MRIALFHLVLASLALAALAAASALVLVRWRARPSASYRLVVAVLAGTLVLAAAQVALERSGLALDLPVPARLWPARTGAPPAPAPEEIADAPALSDPVESRDALAAILAEPPLGEPATESARSEADTRREGAGGLASLLVMAWAIGVVAFLGRTARRVHAARAILARSGTTLDAELARAWRETARAWSSASGVELRTSAELAAPACFGFFQRAILIPRHAQGIEPDCLPHVLLHELIHLERRDSWSMCLAELVRAVFWFHPAAWWLFRRSEELRELSCDALVVERAGRPRTYARGLLACAEHLRCPSEHSLTAALPSWSGSKSQFSRRIEMILQASSGPKSVSWPTRALIGASFALCGGTQLALAASPSQERESRLEASRVDVAQEPSAVREPLPLDWTALDLMWKELPELEELGHANVHDPAQIAAQGHGDRIARATELVGRALARNPDDPDLRDAIELLKQAREERSTDRIARRHGFSSREVDEALEEYRKQKELYARLAAAQKDRDARQAQDEARRRDSELARQRLLEKGRDYVDSRRALKGTLRRSPEGFEAELQEALRLLDDRRAELDALRDRIEDLRARARTRETAPEAEPRTR